jgi:hypothetical protein
VPYGDDEIIGTYNGMLASGVPKTYTVLWCCNHYIKAEMCGVMEIQRGITEEGTA